MSMNPLINILRTSGLSGWVAFAVLYHFGTRGAWRRSRVGPWIMALTVAPLFTLITGVVGVQLGADHPVSQSLRLLLMVVLNGLPLWLAVLFVRRQREIGEIGHEDQPEGVHEGDRGSGERRIRAVPAGDHGEQRRG